MRYAGIARPVDSLGRIVLPKELRCTMDINSKIGAKKGDYLDIYVDGDMIILKKRRTSCVFCGSSENIVSYKGKAVCGQCAEEFKSTI